METRYGPTFGMHDINVLGRRAVAVIRNFDTGVEK